MYHPRTARVSHSTFRMFAAIVGAAVAACTLAAEASAHPGAHAHGAAHGVATAMQAAHAAAPRATRGRCDNTIPVPGLGRACAEGDLFRVQGRDGRSYTTHGADAPPSGEPGEFATASLAAVAQAGPDDIVCVTTPTDVRHSELVYSHPADQPSRYAQVAPQLIQEAYRVSAFLRTESRLTVPGHGVKLVLECDAQGTPVVYEATLPTPAASDSFDTIVADLQALGFGPDETLDARDHYIVYHDSPVASGAGGTADLWDDDTPGTDNASNRGGSFAIEFAWSNAPHWDMLVHEVVHTMGGVQATAPNATDAGHCNDGFDVMCYADGSADSAYTESACVVRVLDCGRDDYFHPAPAPGTYLDTHWNVAGPNNLYLRHTVEEPLPASTTDTANTVDAPPSRVFGVKAVRSPRSRGRAVSVSWRAAYDDVAVTHYLVYRATARGWKLVARVPARSTSVRVAGTPAAGTSGYRVRARDSAGNLGETSMTARLRRR